MKAKVYCKAKINKSRETKEAIQRCVFGALQAVSYHKNISRVYEKDNIEWLRPSLENRSYQMKLVVMVEC